MAITFSIPEATDNLLITLNDNEGVAPTEQVVIGRGINARAWAIMSYAIRHKIAACRVGYAVKEVA